jgi:hypothetical protein
VTHPQPVTILVPQTEAELAYLAGIIDGEGCISRLSRARPRRWTVTVGSTSTELMDWLAAIGGKVHARRANALSRLPLFAWEVISWRNVHLLLISVRPYMIVKRNRADEAIAELSTWIAGAAR